MNKKVELFLKTIGIENNKKLAHSILLFIKKKNCLVLYKNRQLFFIQERTVLSTKELETQSNLIVEFDGVKMQRINSGYYLGISIASAKRYDDTSGAINLDITDLDYMLNGSSNNNNNNNNNNGNNNNG